MVRHHFSLKEASDILSEEIMFLAEDPASSDVHHGLGSGGFRTGRRDRLSELLGLTVLQPEWKNSTNQPPEESGRGG